MKIKRYEISGGLDSYNSPVTYEREFNDGKWFKFDDIMKLFYKLKNEHPEVYEKLNIEVSNTLL